MIGTMADETFQALDRYLETGDRAGSLDYLTEQFRAAGEFRPFFEAKLMKKRLELGLPLIQSEPSSEFPVEVRSIYENAMVEIAKETGALALESGDIVQAWPYFRAIGDFTPIADAIERVDQPGEASEQIIQIAFQQGVHPPKGLEMILNEHGMCRAITAFGMYAVEKGRAECITLLVRKLHEELKDRILRAVNSQEGEQPDTKTVKELIEGRDWLFGEYDYYVDTSHLQSLLPYSLDTKDRETLELYHDLCEYGKKLSPMFQSRGQAPFDEPFVDYDAFVQAMLGQNVEEQIEHFRKKVAASNPDEVGSVPAQLLVNLLVRLERPEEALAVAMEHLSEEDPADLTCPSVLQLCSLAKDYARLKDLARVRGDLLSYVAAS